MPNNRSAPVRGSDGTMSSHPSISPLSALVSGTPSVCGDCVCDVAGSTGLGTTTVAMAAAVATPPGVGL